MNKYCLAFIVCSAVAAGFFLIFPHADLLVSGLFYNETEKFFLDTRIPAFSYIHDSVKYLTISMSALWIGLILLSITTGKIILGLTRRKLIYLLLALIIGPGLVVNTIFKDQWGRARPAAVKEFGGTKDFTPPFIMTDQCERNCSFVSGDPSVGFYLFSLAFAFPARRRLFSGIAASVSAVYGANRIIQGAHFFSDVIFSGVFTISVCYLLYLIIVKGKDDSDAKK